MIDRVFKLDIGFRTVIIFVLLIWAYGSSAQTCDPPRLLTLDTLLDLGVTISWEAGGSEVSWDIDYGPAPHTPSTVGPFQQSGIIDNSALSLMEFTPNETFELYVRAECTEDPDFPVYSEWVGPLTFTTYSDVCQFAENLMECEKQQLQFGFGSEQYPVSCTGSEAGSNWIVEFIPSSFAEYFIHTDSDVNSIMIREKEVCNELNWQCIFSGTLDNSYSLGDLDRNKTYQILIRSESAPQVVIGQCASMLIADYEMTTVDSDLMTTSLEFSNGGTPVEGTFDLFFIEEGMTAPQTIGIPTFSSLSITNGLVSFPTDQLNFDTDYDLYIRLVCSQGDACWDGPFSFETPINCGSAPEVLSIIPRSVNADLTIKGRLGEFWRIEIGAAPFAEPDPLALGTNNLLGAVNNIQDSITFTFLDLQPLTTYQFFLKRDCSNSSIVIGNQPWYGPFEFTTNSDCFVEVQDLNCGQCYASLPAYGHDYFEANFFCGNDDAPSRGERIFRLQRPSSGPVTLSRDLVSVEPFENIIYQFYLKSANEICDLDDWQHLGCWVNGTGGDGNIIIDVEADSVYFLLIDYQTVSTFRYNYHRFEVTADNCGNECQPIQNLAFTPINENSVIVNWDPLPQARGYDLVKVPVGAQPNPNACLFDPPSLFEALVHPDPFYVVSDLTLNQPEDLYVRARCSELNYSPWTKLEIQSQVGQSMQYSNMGTLQYCSPSYRLDGQAILYDQLTFSVMEDGWYQLNQFLQGSSYLRLYESNFDPQQPNENLLASVGENLSTVDEVTLSYP